MRTLVVPTIRGECIREFLNAWRSQEGFDSGSGWDKIIVVEDNPTKTFDIDVDYHYSWEDIDKELGEAAQIISRRDSAIRCFGHYMAWKQGSSYIYDLDDDCYPVAPGFFDYHYQAMHWQPRWIESIPGFRTRGLPYLNRGTMKNVVANMGVWNNIPDLDAIQTIGSGTPFRYKAPSFSRIVPKGQYFPLCGMNFAFRSEVAVLTYFPLMGEGSPYRRFDDIWFGVIFKKICDHLDLAVACGTPAIDHRRASDPMVNLVKEAPGISFNEQFWELVDSCELTYETPKDCMKELGRHLEPGGDYVSKLGRYMQIWADLF